MTDSPLYGAPAPISPRGRARARWRSAIVGAAAGAALLAPASLPAQAAAPFSTFGVSGAVTLDVGRDRLRELWRPGHGGMVRLATPFYAGSVAISAQLAHFRARGDEQPDFRAITRAAEWNAVLPMRGGAEAFAGVQLGAMDMTFLGPAAQTGNPDENELLVGAQGGLSVPVHGGVGIALTVSRRRVLTHVPIDLDYTSAGLEYRARTPAWLRGVLE